MKRFTDNKNRKWDLEVNVAQMKRVRDLTKVNLYKLVDDGLKPLADLLADPITLVDVLYVLCRDQANQGGVSDEDFGRGLAADALQAAAEAFTEELVDFFPEQSQRLSLKKVLTKSKELVQVLAKEVDLTIDTLIPAEMAKNIIRVRAEPGTREALIAAGVPNGSSSAAPASSESTPAPGGSPT